jgi:uncharacterized repeat protein (TIGR01451 family)
VAESSTPGMTITVTPNSVNLAPGGSATFTVEVDVTRVAQNAWYFGAVRWTDSAADAPDAYLPLAVNSAATTNAAALNKVDNKDTVQVGETVQYTITVQNTAFVAQSVTLTDPIPDHATYVPGSATGGLSYNAETDTLSWSGELSPALLQLTEASSPAGYFDISGIPNAALPCFLDESCDEAYVNLTGVDFYYNGEHYTTLGLVTNGYAIPGGLTLVSQISWDNQQFPNPAQPNNVIAPFWDDLNLDAATGTRRG